MFQIKTILPDELSLLIPISDFRNGCKANAFIDDDGIGYLATSTQVSNVVVSPSDMASDSDRNDMRFTHVLWYNK